MQRQMLIAQARGAAFSLTDAIAAVGRRRSRSWLDVLARKWKKLMGTKVQPLST
jgi:hypothetical protein